MDFRRRKFLFSSGILLTLAAIKPASAQAIDVQYKVDAINQGNGDLCWAAATAMLLNWKLPVNTMQSVATQGGAEYVTLYNNAINNASPSQISLDQETRLYKKLNLVVVAGVNPTIEGWRNLLAGKGPLHVTIKPNSSGGMLHGVLITGLVGDGSPTGTTVYFNDPATGTKIDMTVNDFVKLYEGAINWTNNIIHNP